MPNDDLYETIAEARYAMAGDVIIRLDEILTVTPVEGEQIGRSIVTFRNGKKVIVEASREDIFSMLGSKK